MTMIAVKLVTPKVVQQTEAGLLNKSACPAATLGVTKFTIDTDMIWVTLCNLSLT